MKVPTIEVNNEDNNENTDPNNIDNELEFS